MIIRQFEKRDQQAVKEIVSLHWTDKEFIEEVLDEVESYAVKKSKNNIRFYVAEKDNQVVGVSGFKGVPHYLKPYTETSSPVELYILAVRQKRKGIGEKLKQKVIREVKRLGFSEIILFSPNSHKESWLFYDSSGFEGAGEVTSPDDEVGQVWRKIL